MKYSRYARMIEWRAKDSTLPPRHLYSPSASKDVNVKGKRGGRTQRCVLLAGRASFERRLDAFSGQMSVKQLSTQRVSGLIIILYIKMQKASLKVELNYSWKRKSRCKISAMIISLPVYQQLWLSLRSFQQHNVLSCPRLLPLSTARNTFLLLISSIR